MRCLIAAIVLSYLASLAISSTSMAEILIPPEKPTEASAMPLRPSSKPDESGFTLKNTDYMVSANTNSNDKIITPPSVPETKSKLLSIDNISGIIRPATKPLTIRVDAIERIRPQKDFEERVILRYANDNDGRTAGSIRPSLPQDNPRSLPDQPRVQIRETNDESPFETASLQRTKHSQSGQDPVIIFFKENSSELEVGQLTIIETDIVRPLKQNSSRTVSLYGYAETNNQSNDISLSRAILISEYLATQGIDSERIEARSMGSKTSVSPKNRVDVYIMD